MAIPASLSEDLNTLWTSTWQLMRPEAIDQIFNEYPFFFWLNSKGKRRTEAGGRYIGVPLQYAKNTTFKTLTLGSNIDITRQEKLTTAKYEWKYMAISVVRYWVESLQNRGKSQIINIMKNELENARMSISDKLEEMLFADGTGNGGLDTEGLANIVDPTPAVGTVAGINAATYDWWQNKAKDMSGEPMSTYLLKRMRTMYNDCSKGQGSQTPDFLISAQDVFEFYDDEVIEQKQIVNKTLADAEFQTLNYKGKPLVWSTQCPDGYMYFLNSKFLEWVADPAANFDMTKWKEIPNQVNDSVAQIAVSGNLVCGNRARQGVIFNIAE